MVRTAPGADQKVATPAGCGAGNQVVQFVVDIIRAVWLGKVFDRTMIIERCPAVGARNRYWAQAIAGRADPH